MTPQQKLEKELRDRIPGVLVSLDPIPNPDRDLLLQAAYQGRAVEIEWSVSRGYSIYPQMGETRENYSTWSDTAEAAIRRLCPRVSLNREKLYDLAAELIVFTRAAEVRVHERTVQRGDTHTRELHLEVAHPGGLHRAPLKMYEDLGHVMARYAGFSYSLGDYDTREYWGYPPWMPPYSPSPQSPCLHP